MSEKHRGHAKGDRVTYQTPLPTGGVQMETFLPWTLVRRGLKKQVITPLDAPQEFQDEARRERLIKAAAQDTPLVRAFGLAYHWQRLMDEGRFASITEIVEAEGFDQGRASRIARLAQLAPGIFEACATGAAATGVISYRSNHPYHAPGSAGTALYRRSSTHSSHPAWA